MRRQLKNLNRECDLIPDFAVRAWAHMALDNAPKEFWNIPAAFSGKFHPKDEFRKGGKVLHTKRAFVALLYFMRMEGDFTKLETSQMMAAILLHDVCYGHLVKRGHPEAVEIYYTAKIGPGTIFQSIGKPIYRLIECHMGRWGNDHTEPPKTRMEKLVHYADAIVSARDAKFPTIETIEIAEREDLLWDTHHRFLY